MPNSEPTSPALDRLLAEVERRYLENWADFHHSDLGEALLKLTTAVRELVPIPPDLHELLRAFACKQLGINRDVSDAALLEELDERVTAFPAPSHSTAGLKEGITPPVGRVEPPTPAGNGDCASGRERTQVRESAVESIASFVEHLRDEYQSSMEPVGKVARLIREKFLTRGRGE